MNKHMWKNMENDIMEHSFIDNHPILFSIGFILLLPAIIVLTVLFKS